MSFQAVWALASGGGTGALLVSPFNVKWRCSAQAGGVEGSKFCLFSVALPEGCVSSISPRFHFRRHAFCFLLLATILENSWLNSFMIHPIYNKMVLNISCREGGRMKENRRGSELKWKYLIHCKNFVNATMYSYPAQQQRNFLYIL
jgi:hypothetical protein